MVEHIDKTWSVRVGVDLTAIADVEASMATFGERYLRRLFTNHELTSCGAGAEEIASGAVAASLAARFAAKEAVLKVLEPTGSRPEWRDIEVVRRADGSCRIQLHRNAALLAQANGVDGISVSLSHEAGIAVAVVAASVLS